MSSDRHEKSPARGWLADKWPRSWPRLTIFLLAITALYLALEIAFNARLLAALGAPDPVNAGIGQKEISGLEILGRLLSAAAVMLAIGSSYIVQWRRQEAPQPLRLFSRWSRHGAVETRAWGFKEAALAVLVTFAAGAGVFNAEKVIVEMQARSASDAERQQLFYAVRASDGALLWLNERNERLSRGMGAEDLPALRFSPESAFAPATDEAARELAIDAFDSPGGRAFVAIFPYAARDYYVRRGTTSAEMREIADNAITSLAGARSAAQSYAEAYLSFARCIELQYDQTAPYETQEPHAPDAQSRCFDSMLRTERLFSEDPGLKAIAADCVTLTDGTPKPVVDFVSAHCILQRALNVADTAAEAAADDYVRAYRTGRDASVEDLKKRASDEAERARQWSEDFSLMPQDARDALLTGARQQVNNDARLVDLEIGESVIPSSLDGIANCQAFAETVGERVAETAKRQLKRQVFVTGCAGFLCPQWRHTAESRNYCRRLYSHFGVSCPVDGGTGGRSLPSKAVAELTDGCRSNINAAIDMEFRRNIRRIEAIPVEPRSGMLLRERYALLEEARVDSSLAPPVCRFPWRLPPSIQTNVRTRLNSALSSATALRESGLLGATRYAEDDVLPACHNLTDAVVGRFNSALAERNAKRNAPLPDDRVSAARSDIYNALGAFDYRRILIEAVQVGGDAVAQWEGSLVAATRNDIRRVMAAQLQSESLARTTGEAADMARQIIPDTWAPQTRDGFRDTVRSGLRTMIKARFAERLSSAMRIAPEDAAALLDAAPFTSFSAFLAATPVQAAGRRELQCSINVSLAYSGFPAEVGRSVKIASPLGLDFKDAWAREVHGPLISDIQGHLLNTRLTGTTSEFGADGATKGRCYCAGDAAFHRAFIPGFALFVSLLGILYHGRKFLLYALRLLPMPTALRHAFAGLAVLAALAAPFAHTPEILGKEPFAREMVASMNNGPGNLWAQSRTDWMIRAQDGFFPASRFVHQTLGELRFDWFGREPKPSDAEVVRHIEENDSRIAACRSSNAGVLDLAVVRQTRQFMHSRGVCALAGAGEVQGKCFE